MSERKVLNKYYPPDFDPSKIPRMKLAKNRQYTVRLMAPFNMRCKTCGEYIYKGKKFNARKEDVENETYLGIRIYRFYIKCTRCLQEISFKTDPRNTDYEIEAGATRNFMALKMAEDQARREEAEAREEEANNPMKMLENRTEQSKNEIEMLESLEELRDLNRRHESINYNTMLQQYDNRETERERLERQEREDEEYIKSLNFPKPQRIGVQSDSSNSTSSTKRIVAEEIIEELPTSSNPQKQPINSVTKSNLSATSSSIFKTGAASSHQSLKARQNQLVVLKKPSTTTVPGKSKSITANTSDPVPAKQPKLEEKKTNGLAMVAMYSDSSDSTGSNEDK